MSELIHYSSDDDCQHCLHFFAASEVDTNAPIVLLFPAMGVKAPYYFKLAESLNDLGLHFACTDLRGNGPMHQQPSWGYNFGYAEMLKLDWPAAIQKIKQRYPDNPLYLMGHSLGGQLSACYTAMNPKDVNGVIIIAAGNVHYKAFHHKWRTLFGTQFLSLSSHLFGYMPGNTLGFAGREARQVMRDWAYNARTGRYRIKLKTGYHLLDGYLTQLKRPVLAISFDGDKFSPHSSMVKLLDKMPCAPKQHIRTSALEMDVAEIGHFSWVKHTEKLAPKIHQWIQQSHING